MLRKHIKVWFLSCKKFFWIQRKRSVSASHTQLVNVAPLVDLFFNFRFSNKVLGWREDPYPQFTQHCFSGLFSIICEQGYVSETNSVQLFCNVAIYSHFLDAKWLDSVALGWCVLGSCLNLKSWWICIYRGRKYMSWWFGSVLTVCCAAGAL